MSAVDYSAKATTTLRLLTGSGSLSRQVKTVLGGYDPEEDEFGWYQWYFQYSGAYNPGRAQRFRRPTIGRTGALLGYGKGIEYVRGMQVTQRDKRLLLDASGAADQRHLHGVQASSTPCSRWRILTRLALWLCTICM